MIYRSLSLAMLPSPPISFSSFKSSLVRPSFLVSSAPGSSAIHCLYLYNLYILVFVSEQFVFVFVQSVFIFLSVQFVFVLVQLVSHPSNHLQFSLLSLLVRHQIPSSSICCKLYLYLYLHNSDLYLHNFSKNNEGGSLVQLNMIFFKDDGFPC